VKVQTNTWYLLPHSVTTYCVAYKGQLYLTSVYPAGIVYPNGRNWNANVARDPHVRIKIGNNVYDRVLSYVTNPAEHSSVLEMKWGKYPKQVIAPNATVNEFTCWITECFSGQAAFRRRDNSGFTVLPSQKNLR